jgi:YfiH family protein
MAVFSFFGTSLYGDGRIQSNIKKYLTENNIRYKYVIYPSQFHSTTVREVTALNYHDDFRCDGLITKEKGIVLVIVTADCVPIIYTDSNKGIIEISHQGWKGTLNKLPRQIIHEMELLGSSVANIQCEIGPHIGECCYHIYGERKNQFIHTFGESVISTHEEKTN